jgi:hypothetical protein
MDTTREMLEEQLETSERKLQETSSFIKELKARTAEYGTDKDHYTEDLMEAEHNVKYYESEITRLKDEIGGAPQGTGGQAAADNILPQTMKQGLGSFMIASLSFVGGVLLGANMKSRRRRDRAED